MTYSIANTSSTVLPWFEGVCEGDDDARAGVADGMAECDGTSVKNAEEASVSMDETTEDR